MRPREVVLDRTTAFRDYGAIISFLDETLLDEDFLAEATRREARAAESLVLEEGTPEDNVVNESTANAPENAENGNTTAHA